MILAPGRLREQTGLRPAWVTEQENKSIFLSNLYVFSAPYCSGKVCFGNLLCPFSSRQTLGFPSDSEGHFPQLVFSQPFLAQAMGSENFWAKLVCTVVTFVSQ